MIIGNWLSIYSPSACGLLNALIDTKATKATKATEHTKNTEEMEETEENFGNFIDIEYMSGIIHTKIPFQHSITVHDILKILYCRCYLFLPNSDIELQSEQVFTSNSTIVIVLNTELIQLCDM